MNPSIEIKTELSGRYKFKISKPDGSVRLETDWMNNLITNRGLDQIGGTDGDVSLLPVCAVGTSNTPPAFTDTQLVTYLASAGAISSTTTFVEGTPAYWRRVVVYRFSTGAAAGNLTEVGVGHSTVDLFSRALIVDGGGSPTTITVLSDEVLDVTYELRSYINKSDINTTFTISGSVYTVLMRPDSIGTPPLIERSLNGHFGSSETQITAYSQNTLGTVYQSVQGGGATPFTNGAWNAYVIGSYQKDATYTFALSNGNHTGGIGAFAIFCTQAKYQMSFSPKIPKAFFNVLTVMFRFSWGRYP
jgi:Pantothenate kinase, acetyl-CoA regulated